MIYTYRCTACKETHTRVRRVAHRHDAADCDCGAPARLEITPVAVNTSGCTFEPFQSPAIKGKPVITSERQRREMMKRHDLVDANELYSPPTEAEQKQQHEAVLESVNAISDQGLDVGPSPLEGVS